MLFLVVLLAQDRLQPTSVESRPNLDPVEPAPLGLGLSAFHPDTLLSLFTLAGQTLDILDLDNPTLSGSDRLPQTNPLQWRL